MGNKNLLVISIYTMTLLFAACGNTKNNNTGTFTDSRDGKIYKTIQMGSQTWMAENLAYKTSSGCWAYDKNSNLSIRCIKDN